MLTEYILRILFAGLVGGLIGLERAYHDKSAGFRTMIMIATGSALFTIISMIVGSPAGDGARIAAAVVTGVGFLGAGAIVKEGISIHGLTTSASIWIVASLGMGAGLGLYSLTGVVTLLMMVVLWMLPPIEHRVDALHEFVTFNICIKNTNKLESKVLDCFSDVGIKIIALHRTQPEKGSRVLHVTVKTTPQKRELLSERLVNEKSIQTFTLQ